MICGSIYMTMSDIITYPGEEPDRLLYRMGRNVIITFLFYMLLLVWCCCTFWTLQDWRNPYHREGKIGDIDLGSSLLLLISVCGCVWEAHSWPIFPNTQPPSALLSWPFYYLTSTGIRIYTESPGIDGPDRCVLADDLTIIKTPFLIEDMWYIYITSWLIQTYILWAVCFPFHFEIWSYPPDESPRWIKEFIQLRGVGGLKWNSSRCYPSTFFTWGSLGVMPLAFSPRLRNAFSSVRSVPLENFNARSGFRIAVSGTISMDGRWFVVVCGVVGLVSLWYYLCVWMQRSGVIVENDTMGRGEMSGMKMGFDTLHSLRYTYVTRSILCIACKWLCTS